jgi:hypothetical protein
VNAFDYFFAPLRDFVLANGGFAFWGLSALFVLVFTWLLYLTDRTDRTA